MRLHRVQLRNYRGVTESTICFAKSGVTIVEGPNEVGKTSIAEALQMAIELLDSSKKALVKSVQTVGRDTGPEVEIALSSGKYDLTYEKRWLRSPQTILSVTSPQGESRTGRDAHNRLKEILAETLDDELWSALRIEQGIQLNLPSFSMPAMRRALDRAAGGEYASDDDDTLWGRIKEEYGRYWTLTGHKKGERRSLEGRVQNAKDEAHNLELQVNDVDKDVERMTRFVKYETQIKKTKDDLDKSERELSKEWRSIERIVREIERSDANRAAAEAKRDQVAGEWDRRQELLKNFEKRDQEFTDVESEAKQTAPRLADAIRAGDEAGTALKEMSTAFRSAEAKLTRATRDRDHLREQIDVELLTERLERYLEAEKTLEKAEDYLEAAKVDDAVLDEIELAFLDNERAQATARNAAASIETTALGDICLRVADKDHQLAVNEVLSLRVENEIELVVPGIVGIRVNAGPDSKKLTHRRITTQATYERLCEDVGVTDLNEARNVAQRRRDAVRNRKEARKAIKRDLRDLTPGILRGKIKNLTESVASYPLDRPGDPPLPPTFEEAGGIVVELARKVEDLQLELRSCEVAAANARNESGQVKANEADLEARRKAALANRDDAANSLDLARKSKPDKELVGELALAQSQFESTFDALQEIQGQLKAADPDSLQTRLENVRDARRRAYEEHESNKEKQNALQASLDYRSEKGLRSHYEAAIGQLRQVQREHDGTEGRAMAAKLLYEKFEMHRRQAHQRYIEPLKKRIDQLGRIVFGPTFAVELSEDLQVVRRSLDGTTLELDQLSTGTREQLGVLSRLACAMIVSPDDGGAPVMIDDALGWSDPQRLESMGAAIAAAGKQCQVVVLTCTPGRYSHVGNAKVVPLNR